TRTARGSSGPSRGGADSHRRGSGPPRAADRTTTGESRQRYARSCHALPARQPGSNRREMSLTTIHRGGGCRLLLALLLASCDPLTTTPDPDGGRESGDAAQDDREDAAMPPPPPPPPPPS